MKFIFKKSSRDCGLMDQSFFIKEAEKIVKLGMERGISIRVMGACAIAIHSSKRGHELYDKLNRPLSDLDFITTESRDKVKSSLLKLATNQEVDS